MAERTSVMRMGFIGEEGRNQRSGQKSKIKDGKPPLLRDFVAPMLAA
jgi:hypothetical protein